MIRDMIKPQTLKGFRDFLPKEAKKRQYVINILKDVFESYGFEPLETPALEYEEILLGKYGEEDDKLMYRFEDNGKRKVALRYDQTVPLARVIAQYQNKLPMPFKRYQIQNVWRGERPQKGRYREFLQCDIDTVGSSSLLSDVEIISVALNAIKKLGFKNSYFEINDRLLFENTDQKFITAIDKLKKIGQDGVIKELIRKGLSQSDAAITLQRIKKTEKTKTISEVFSLLKSFGFEENKDFKFSPILARGLDYYTELIFELINPDYGDLALGAGGRYDNLIGMFAGKNIPAVGFAFGFDRLMEAMDQLNLFPANLALTKVLVTIFSKELKQQSLDCSLLLRSSGVSTQLYLDENAKLDKQLKYADQKEMPYAVIIGPEEAKNNTVTLRNMQTREQKTLPLSPTILLTELGCPVKS